MKKLILLATSILLLSACSTQGTLKSDSDQGQTNAQKLLERQNQRF